MTEPIAVLADIHANIWALDAVFEDAEKRKVKTFLNLGDILYGPLRPRQTYDRLRSENVALTICGNQDRLIAGATANNLRTNPTLSFVLRDLGEEPIRWLAQLPKTAIYANEILLCHGSPSSDEVYLLEATTSGQPLVKEDICIVEQLRGVHQPVILCGHSHLPRLVELSTGQLVVNPGSVGVPAYEVGEPVPHRMETFAPHASYAILEKIAAGWMVSFHRVPYHHGAAAVQAESLGRKDWARNITRGRMER
ncbi:MAG TPA: metallophosphoesterase family protein [Terriglobia bacterium]|nr:metallophosphoesterase family protein [Terriglobia bacterium]